jgi:hypothetical protein
MESAGLFHILVVPALTCFASAFRSAKAGMIFAGDGQAGGWEGIYRSTINQCLYGLIVFTYTSKY